MAIPSEITKAIELIDSRISDLRQAKATLLAAFGANSERGNAKIGVSVHQLVMPAPQGTTRKETLKNFLLTHGPATRSQVAASLPDFPEGTLAYLLNEKQGFKRNDDGLWMVTQEEAFTGTKN
jgi:hypothetical protein